MAWTWRGAGPSRRAQGPYLRAALVCLQLVVRSCATRFLGTNRAPLVVGIRGGWHSGRRGSMATREPQFEPKTTEDARQVIETTRERISRALAAIEGRSEATRDRIGATAELVKNKVNVLKPVSRQVRSHPWPSVGVALGTGVLLGLLAAGKDEEEREHEARRRKMLSAREREERRRWRARRRERLAERGFGAEEGKGRIRSMIGRQVRAAMAGLIL